MDQSGLIMVVEIQRSNLYSSQISILQSPMGLVQKIVVLGFSCQLQSYL